MMQTQTQTSKKSSKNLMPVKTKANSKTNSKDQPQAVDSLQKFLADSVVLYMKTYAVHWNYQGAKFFAVHKLTEQQYGELYEAIDELAERIRAQRDVAPFSLQNMLQNADLEELQNDEGRSDRSVRNLVESHQALAEEAKRAIDELEDRDPFTADLLTSRIGAHDKAAWMLRSLLA